MEKKISYNKKLKRYTCDNPECEKSEIKISKSIFLTGLFITSMIFLMVFVFNSNLNDVRNEFISKEMNNVIANHESMQTLLFMSQIYGDEAICVVYNNMIKEMNEGLWELGTKIDQYRETSENFQKDPFYIEQKKNFNRKSVLYFAIMNDMNKKCQLNKNIISYFYHKKEICPKCDAQSFVLSDLKNDLKKIKGEDILAIFSFDSEMNIPGIDLLLKVHNITEFPAIVIDDEVFVGLHSKDMLMSILCKENNLELLCEKYSNINTERELNNDIIKNESKNKSNESQKNLSNNILIK
jgi:hypothetical protein